MRVVADGLATERKSSARAPADMPSQSPTRILLIRLSHMGDVVQTFALYHALRERHPQAELGWAIQPEFAGLIDGLDGVARTFLFDRRGGLGAWTRLRRELRAWRPSWTIDAQGNAKSAAVALSTGAPRRSGFARRDWTERAASLVTNDRAPRAAGPHAMQRVLSLCGHVADGFHPRHDPALDERETSAGEDAFVERFPRGDGAGWIVHLAAGADVRSWPAPAFAALAERLAAAGRPVLLLSGPAESELGRELAAASTRPEIGHWVGQRGLRALAGFLSAAAKRGVRLVGCDSGPAHLAAACGMGVDLLAGPQDPDRTGPWPRNGLVHRVLTRPDPPDCQPCRARVCSHAEGPICMRGITPAQVSERLLAE